MCWHTPSEAGAQAQPCVEVVNVKLIWDLRVSRHLDNTRQAV